MRNRYGLITALTTALLFLLLEAASVVMMVNNGAVQRFKVVGALRHVEAGIWGRTQQVRNYFGYGKENERLSAENLRLRQELARYAAAAAALDSHSVTVTPDFTFIRAGVIRNSVNAQHNYLVLDRGSDDGVETGMGVITDRGVVGIVSAVTRRYSYVISLLSTGQSVSAKLAASGAFGPLHWPGTTPDRVVLREIPVHVQAAPGDTVVTSGYSTIYPPDIPIGSVVESRINQGSSQDLSVRLFEDFRTLHYVYIVRNNNGPELQELYEQAL